MAKFCGNIGFATQVELRPGVIVERITTKHYRGDLLRVSRQLQSSSQLNDNINISNEISIVADPFAFQNIYAIRYVEYAGAKWKISGVEEKYPRLILTIGGLYNAATAT